MPCARTIHQEFGSGAQHRCFFFSFVFCLNSLLIYNIQKHAVVRSYVYISMSDYKFIILCNPSSRNMTGIPDTPFQTQAAMTSNTIQFCLLELDLHRITEHVLFWSGFLCPTLYLLLMCVGVIFFVHFCIIFYCENIAHILGPFSHWCTYGCFHVFGSFELPIFGHVCYTCTHFWWICTYKWNCWGTGYIYVCSVLVDTSKLFPKSPINSYSTSSIWEFSLFYTL